MSRAACSAAGPRRAPCALLADMIYAVIAASAIAFAPPASLHHATAVRASTPLMTEVQFGRRELMGVAAAGAAFAPLAAFADGATSPATLERARAIYGA